MQSKETKKEPRWTYVTILSLAIIFGILFFIMLGNSSSVKMGFAEQNKEMLISIWEEGLNIQCDKIEIFEPTEDARYLFTHPLHSEENKNNNFSFVTNKHFFKKDGESITISRGNAVNINEIKFDFSKEEIEITNKISIISILLIVITAGCLGTIASFVTLFILCFIVFLYKIYIKKENVEESLKSIKFLS